MGLGTGLATVDDSTAILPMLFDRAVPAGLCVEDSESDALSQASSSAHSTDAYEEKRDGALRPIGGRVGGGRGIPIITSMSCGT